MERVALPRDPCRAVRCLRVRLAATGRWEEVLTTTEGGRGLPCGWRQGCPHAGRAWPGWLAAVRSGSVVYPPSNGGERYRDATHAFAPTDLLQPSCPGPGRVRRNRGCTRDEDRRDGLDPERAVAGDRLPADAERLLRQHHGQPVDGLRHLLGELHATGWFYTNLPSAEGWSENDDEHPFHEEFIVWWDPYGMVAGEPYDIDVEFWDPHVGSKGSINFAQSQNVAFLRDSQPFSTWWKDKFCTGPYDQGKPEEYNARPMFVYPCDWK